MSSDDISERQLIQDATHLEKAYKLKEEANARYKDKNYSRAIMLYHQCLLHARAVQQLSQFGLQGLARMERETKNIESDDEENGHAEKDESEDVMPAKLDEKPRREGEKRPRISSTSRGEEMKGEAIDLTLKCYNNLAACILHGINRTDKDYLRAVDYCDKVLAVDAKNEKALYRKGVALAKANLHDKAIPVLKLCYNNCEARAAIQECERVLSEEKRRRDDQIRRNFARASARAQGLEANENVIPNMPPPVATMNGTASATAAAEEIA